MSGLYDPNSRARDTVSHRLLRACSWLFLGARAASGVQVSSTEQASILRFKPRESFGL